MEIKFRFSLVNLARAKIRLKMITFARIILFIASISQHPRERINGDIKLIDDNNWKEKNNFKCALKLFPEIITLI